METHQNKKTEENAPQAEGDSVQTVVMQEEYKPECREVTTYDIENARDCIRISRTLLKERLDQIKTENPSYGELATLRSLKVDLSRADNAIIRLTTILV